MSEHHSHSINIKASLRVAKDPDFSYSGMRELRKFTAGACAEGHGAKTVFVFTNKRTGEEIQLGSVCQFKPFLFRRWPNLKESDLYDDKGNFDKSFLSIGKSLWKIVKDNLEPEYAEAEKALGYSVDVSRVPPKLKRDEVAKQYRALVSKSIAIRKAAIKAKKEKKSRELRRSAYGGGMRTMRLEEIARERAAKDDLYQQFSSARFSDPRAESIRQSMLNNYIAYGGSWTEPQRRKVFAMLKYESRVGSSGSTKSEQRSAVSLSSKDIILVAIIKIVMAEDKLSGARFTAFLDNVVKILSTGYRLTVKQRDFLSKILFMIKKIQDDATMIKRIEMGFKDVASFEAYVNSMPVRA